MGTIGLFYGSSSGVTRNAAQKIASLMDDVEVIDMEEDFEGIDHLLSFDMLLLGSSTWGQGDPQRDWVDVLYEMGNDEPDFSGKKVALFGAGDQQKHGEHFVSALGKMYDLFTKLGANVQGFTSTQGYDFTFSLAQKGEQFCGLAIDDLNQADQTDERITLWVNDLKKVWGL